MMRCMAAAAILSLSLPASGRELALSQLRAGAADAETPAPPSADRPLVALECGWGDYKGTCFYRSATDDVAVYYILRKRGPNGPFGRGIVGYRKVRDRQRAYNQWAASVFANGEYPGVYASAESFGWAASSFVLPPLIEDTGEVNNLTIRIPYFTAGALIARLWNRFREDCGAARVYDPDTAFTAEVCALGIHQLDPDILAGDGTLRDRLLQRRARWLVAAYRDTLRFDELMREAPPEIHFPQDLPPGFAERLAGVIDDIDNDLRAAGSSPVFDDKGMLDAYLRQLR